MSIEMEKAYGDIRTDKFINQKDQTVNISFDEYRKLKHDASKWAMITWAIDNEKEFNYISDIIQFCKNQKDGAE